MKKSAALSKTIELNTCASRREERPVTAIFCCTASPGAHNAATKCTLVIKAAGNMSAITCARMRASICQHIRAAQVDAAVADAFLTALAPAEIEALSRASRTRHQIDTALHSSAERQLERKRYEAALAERQFNRVDPDNRLVAGELERRWEAALNEVRAAEEALARLSAPQPLSQTVIGKTLNSKIIVLAGRLPQIWADPATTAGQRKALLRCLVEKVVLDRGERDMARLRIVWRGGAVSELDVKMKVNALARLVRGAEMRERLLDLARAGMADDEIAAILTAEGHRSPNCPEKVRPITVQRIRLGAGLKTARQRTRWNHDPGLLSATEL